MNDHVGNKFTCGREMGSNEFSWSGLIIKILMAKSSSVSICLTFKFCQSLDLENLPNINPIEHYPAAIAIW